MDYINKKSTFSAVHRELRLIKKVVCEPIIIDPLYNYYPRRFLKYARPIRIIITQWDSITNQWEILTEEQLESSFSQLTAEMQFVLKRLESEEQEVIRLEEKTNKLLAQKLFKSFKKIDGDKNKD